MKTDPAFHTFDLFFVYGQLLDFAYYWVSSGINYDNVVKGLVKMLLGRLAINVIANSLID